MKKVAMIVGLVLATLSGVAIGHSGGTNSMGCHTDHRTGFYHCH